ncbi:General transcription factor II-I repeat domain-containing protein 2 [Thelohanellus kitauei]|uniref:General transcription factor II-I repeat domain-containing protein 2 n=1 Tax=Thelohanellus kitauei TaxID=669202 RepID=A0A0C2JN77_THEKT|nr:General transcription factor II-I repeat domain-containing protein 2 [Thelohanellus kitauei]
MDESNDISDTAQVAVFKRAINDNIDIIDEIFGLEPIHSSTKVSDLFEILNNLGEKNNMEWGNLVSICTDEALAMGGSRSGCLTLLEHFYVAQYLNITVFFTKKLCMGKY